MPQLIEPALASEAVMRGARRYFTERRRLIRGFVARHYGLKGALRLHRNAIGWDLLRAPANLVLAPAHVAVKAAAPLLRRVGLGRLAARGLLLETRVSREVAFRVGSELLELPCRDGGRACRRDALLAAIIDEAVVADRLAPALAGIGRAAEDPGFRARLEAALETYAGTRAAAAEISAGLLTVGVGAAAAKQLTPGAVTLGPVLAGLIAQQAAIGSFPLGAALGSLWYGVFPAAASPLLVGGVTVGLMGGAALAASFAGIVADPLQKALGLHERRLHRMIDALEAHFEDPEAPGFLARDHYVARLLDVMDLVAGAWRLAVH